MDEMEQPAYDDAGGDESPDLNPDGSLKKESTETEKRGLVARLRSLLPW